MTAYEETLEGFLALTGYNTGGRKVPMDSRKMARMERIVRLSGNPHKSFSTVQVSGTKGKGTTAAMVAAGLRASGYKTGLYLSPHVYEFTERINVDGTDISREDLAALLLRAKDWLVGDDPATFFEAFTLAAFIHFRNESVEWAVLETGIGGRHSATNIVDPECGIITSIGKDHADIIGPGISEITSEKAGIGRAGKPLVVPRLDAESMLAIHDNARAVGMCLNTVECNRAFSPVMPEEHQKMNASLAMAAFIELSNMRLITLNDESAFGAIEKVSLPGRFETINLKPLVVFDGAHTPESCDYLRQAVSRKHPSGGYGLIFASKTGKEVEGMLKALIAGARFAVFPQTGMHGFEHPDKLIKTAEKIKKDIKLIGSDDMKSGILKAIARGGEAPIIVTGSFYIGSLAKEALKTL